MLLGDIRGPLRSIKDVEAKGITKAYDITNKVMLWHQLNERYYGPDLEVDPLLDGEWSRIPHFYSPFYVFQYATGYAAATSLSRQIQKGGEPARKRYLHMLTRGGSAHPIDLLRDAGVDMATPQPLLDTLRVFEETLDAFEELANRK